MKENKCLIENCDRNVYSRGLCDICYQIARLMVRKSETSWTYLIEKGLAKDVRARGNDSLFKIEFLKIKNSNNDEKQN